MSVIKEGFNLQNDLGQEHEAALLDIFWIDCCELFELLL